MQREIPMMAELRAPQMLPDAVISLCDDMDQAIRLCICQGRYKYNHKGLAEALDIMPPHLSMMLNGKRQFPCSKLPALMRLCGNLAPVQWLDREMHGADLDEIKREISA